MSERRPQGSRKDEATSSESANQKKRKLSEGNKRKSPSPGKINFRGKSGDKNKNGPSKFKMKEYFEINKDLIKNVSRKFKDRPPRSIQPSQTQARENSKDKRSRASNSRERERIQMKRKEDLEEELEEEEEELNGEEEEEFNEEEEEEE